MIKDAIMENDRGDYRELIPGLPDELALECLTRLHYSAHGISSRVCRRWRDLFRSTEFYNHRKKNGFTHRAACLIQALPVQSGSKPTGQPRYGISLFDPVNLSWDRIDPVPKYLDGLPLFCQVARTEGKLVVMGGMDPSSWEPIRDVFVYDFRTQRWSRSVDMPSTRSFFAAGAIGGEIVVAGGHDESKNALKSAWILDVERKEWRELRKMSEERDECEGVVDGSDFWVVSGYATETQGFFKSNAEVLDMASGEWRRVEDCWARNRCPRSCVGMMRKGKIGNSLVCWPEEVESVQGAACAVELGGEQLTLVTGSGYQGGPHGFYLIESMEGQKGKVVKIDGSDAFGGFVQSGCSTEI